MRHPRRVFGYVRVSGAEQGRTGTSLEGQREEIERHCAARGFPAPRIVLEVASAGREKLEQRVELKAMLLELVAGDLVVVTKVDRWSRDIAWGVQSVRDLVARGIGWTSIGENLDATTAQGDSTLGIMSWVADQERARIRERTVGRRKELRDLGLYVEGRAPVGYERHARRLRVVEGDAEIVRQVYAWSVGGASIGQIVARLRAEHPSRHGWDH
jgi:DNA invertase Pin-like site-specific DNA recombinase